MNQINSFFEQIDREMSYEPIRSPRELVGFHVINLGCKVNRVESDDISAALEARGLHNVAPVDADVLVINTCTVTGEAEKKTRKAVRQALRANDHARVFVTGCSVAINAETYQDMSERIQIVPKGQFMDTVMTVLDESHALRVGKTYPTRVGVKVQDGCNNACTYCIVHVARGKATSRNPEEIVREIQQYEQAGVREIVLTGINLGSYRWATDEKRMRLADLLSMILLSTSRVRLRVSSIEPRDIDDEVIHVIAHSHGRICRHLHLPLQSGSSKVLKEMARPYRAEMFADLVKKLYERIPELSLSTDIIVGFPGETDEEFEETCRMAQACRFSKIHIFRYSQREGTPAAKRPDQIAPEVKAQRAKKLEQLEEELRLQDLQRRSGTKEWALVESTGLATTESYHTIKVSDSVRIGELVECIL